MEMNSEESIFSTFNLEMHAHTSISVKESCCLRKFTFAGALKELTTLG